MDWQEGRGSRVEKVDERRMQAREKRVSVLSKKYDNNRGYIIVMSYHNGGAASKQGQLYVV